MQTTTMDSTLTPLLRFIIPLLLLSSGFERAQGIMFFTFFAAGLQVAGCISSLFNSSSIRK